jgi:restriction system-associated AAA family ATPase
MKLLRLKITDPNGFRSLHAGFEYCFRDKAQPDVSVEKSLSFAPFVCAGPNGSGKSNLLELLAAIFYHLDCMTLQRLPDSFLFDAEDNLNGFNSESSTPNAFELEYLIPVELDGPEHMAHVKVIKKPNSAPEVRLMNRDGVYKDHKPSPIDEVKRLLPDYVLAYSSGENEILSLPFFKMRFIQFDEYRQTLVEQLSYSGSPESRLVYLDTGFSQAILLCNLLFQNPDTLKPFREEVGLEKLNEFRVVIRNSIPISFEELSTFDLRSETQRQQKKNELRATLPRLQQDEVGKAYRADIAKSNDAITPSEDGEENYRLRLIDLLDGEKAPSDVIARFKKCATCWFEDTATDTVYLDFYVNDATREAFQNNFGSALELFQAFQALLTLNLYSVSDEQKAELYQSNSLYVSETVPSLPSDERITRIKHFWVNKVGVTEPVLLKGFSDGEHQLMHTIGLCLLFKDTNSLFLLDEPETHFNPSWRANFITRLNESLGANNKQEMLITTHSPFLISDSTPDKVLEFEKIDGEVQVNNPTYNTLGASINRITMETFDKRETIGKRAQNIIDEFRSRSLDADENKEALITEINQRLGDSVEKVLLIKSIIDDLEKKG